MKTARLVLACALMVSVSVTTWVAPAVAGYDSQVSAQTWTGVTRVAGSDRYDTAVQVSKRYFTSGASTVLVATGENWADALCASALAGAYDSPLLLVKSQALPVVVRDEIVRLKPSRVVLLGGTAAISDTVGKAIDAIPGVAVERLAGNSRYETAEVVAARFKQVAGSTWSGQVFVATGENFPDALGASAVAAHSLSPIILTAGNDLPAASSDAIKALSPKRALLLGGVGVVTSRPENAIKALGVTVQRFPGVDRYDTCVQVVKYAQLTWGMPSKSVGLSSGATFPDALGAGAALGHAGQLQVLSNKSALSSSTDAFFAGTAGHTSGVSAFGGAAALQQGVLDRVTTILNVTWTHLDEGDSLLSSQSLESPNGQYTLGMQSDGNLVLRYKTSGRALWATGTDGNAGAYLRMQSDGNLVVYSKGGTALWNSKTAGKDSARLDVQNDGNVVVYYTGGAKGLSGVNTTLGPNDVLTPGQYIWSVNSRYQLVMQGDGNLVYYDRGVTPAKALWNTGTFGNNYAVMQGDGNLVVYQGGTAVWNSRTAGHAGARLVAQADNNLVIWDGATAIWTRTGGAATSREARAVDWANSQVGSMNYHFLCLAFVADAYGCSSGYGSALQMYNAMHSLGVINTSATGIPKGALVFSSDPTYDLGNGHVMLSRGDGTFVSGGADTDADPRTVKIFDSIDAAHYLGWCMAPSSWPGR